MEVDYYGLYKFTVSQRELKLIQNALKSDGVKGCKLAELILSRIEGGITKTGGAAGNLTIRVDKMTDILEGKK